MSEWRLRVGPVVRIVVQGVCKQICKRIRCVCACFLAGFFRILNAKALAALVKVNDGGERLVIYRLNAGAIVLILLELYFLAVGVIHTSIQTQCL